MEKYMQRCRNLRGLALGLQATAFQYNMFCTTVLSFVGQISADPCVCVGEGGLLPADVNGGSLECFHVLFPCQNGRMWLRKRIC